MGTSSRHDVKGSTGLMVVRAWTEPGSTEPLRAHIRIARDVAHGFERSFTVSRKDSVVSAVEAWLASVCDEAVTSHEPVTD